MYLSATMVVQCWPTLGLRPFSTSSVSIPRTWQGVQSELLSPDGNINMDLFSKESDVYAYAILVCQKVCIQLILSMKKHSQDSRYSPEMTLSLGIRKDTSTMEKCWVVSPGGRPSTKEILQLLGQRLKDTFIYFISEGL